MSDWADALFALVQANPGADAPTLMGKLHAQGFPDVTAKSIKNKLKKSGARKTAADKHESEKQNFDAVLQMFAEKDIARAFGQKRQDMRGNFTWPEDAFKAERNKKKMLPQKTLRILRHAAGARVRALEADVRVQIVNEGKRHVQAHRAHVSCI